MRALFGLVLGLGLAHADTTVSNPKPADDLLARTAEVTRAMKSRDFAALAKLADPAGVRFSPYAPGDDATVRLSPGELEAPGTRKRRWGSFDGSGLPIRMSLAQYFARFVWDRDFTQARPAVVGAGRVQLRVPASEKDGMDWHNEWTI